MAGLTQVLGTIGTVSIIVGILIELVGHDIWGEEGMLNLFTKSGISSFTGVCGERGQRPCGLVPAGVFGLPNEDRWGRKHPTVSWL